EHLEQVGNSSNFGELAEELLEIAPDTEEFDHPLTSAALNAALSIAATISLISDGGESHVVEAASLARDTAALYAQVGATASPA
ncbi:hypothetical protein, partial [Bacillus sp. II_CA]|uniref:hypothetical protein n=1 Tax=Bacillus sp. II_CA TaxID=3417451 RepID=UPI003CF5A7C6